MTMKTIALLALGVDYTADSLKLDFTFEFK